MKKTIKKHKKSTEELMKAVIDEELLKKRKEENEIKKNTVVKSEEKPQEEKKELKWYEKPVLEKDFKYKKVDNEFYAQHKEWNKHVWIGGYPTEYEAKQVVKDYCKECKKNILERNIKNIHSVLFDDE